jgi:predicted dehydrogenase
MTASSDLRLGVVGLGVRSVVADQAHRPGRGARVVAACDPAEMTWERARERFGADLFVTADARDLLDRDLDAVMVLTPDHTHQALATTFLRAGVPVFVEKPLAITTADCDDLLRTARDAGTGLYVGHNMRHMPVVLAMRDLVLSGEVGEVKAIWCRHFVGHGGDYYYKDWHADRRNTTSLLLQKGAHDLDVLHWLGGAPTRRVHAMGALTVYGQITDRKERRDQRMHDWLDPDAGWPPLAHTGLHPVVDVEDISMVQMRLANGVFASYQQCHYTPDYWRNYTVIGTEGRLENFGDTDGAVVKVWKRRSGYRSDADRVIEVPPGEGTHGGADAALVEEFLRFVRDGVPTRTSPVAARDAVAAGCAATHSLRADGVPVDVPPVDEQLAAYFASGQEPVHDPTGRR